MTLSKKYCILLSIFLLTSSIAFSGVKPYYNVLDYGAAGDGQTNDAAAINAAIDAAIAAAAQNGGGTVYFPPGDYLSYTIHLQSNITIFLDNRAVLIGDKETDGVGTARATENVSITNCQIFGYDHGTMLDGTFRTEFKDEDANANHCITGRLKLATESNGGFKNITVSNCIFERSCGITISNLNVYDVGGRPKAPELGAGMVIPGHYIEDLTLSNIRIYFRGGGPKEAMDKEAPQNIDMYPDPYRWESMPAYGIYFRYVKGLRVNNVVLRYMNKDERPAFVLDDVHNARFFNIDAQKGAGAPQFILKNVSDISIHEVDGVENI